MKNNVVYLFSLAGIGLVQFPFLLHSSVFSSRYAERCFISVGGCQPNMKLSPAASLLEIGSGRTCDWNTYCVFGVVCKFVLFFSSVALSWVQSTMKKLFEEKQDEAKKKGPQMCKMHEKCDCDNFAIKGNAG